MNKKKITSLILSLTLFSISIPSVAMAATNSSSATNFTTQSSSAYNSASYYKSTIDSFNVTNNSKYLPHNGQTFCNIFAQDVARKLGTPLPSGTCDTMLNCLLGNKTPHWYSVSASMAQSRANQGYCTIGITKDHVVVVYPHGNTANSVYDVYMSMSGYQCFNDKSITYAWRSSVLPTVKFYSWYN